MPRVRSPVRAVAGFAALVLLVMVACAPRVAAVDTPASREAERTAHEAFHLMELGRLRLGVYTTNVLVDLDLPRGARITAEAFEDDDYRLRLTADAVPEIAWLVTPRGVRRVAH